jgi:DNA polymerase III epsilon subunit-like protein
MALDLSQPWRSCAYVSVDFEATSPDPATCEPVEVAVVRFDGAGNVVKRFSTLLRTAAPIPEDATKVHGITDEMVRDAPTLYDVAHKILEVAQDAIPLAFNRRYDRTIMHRHLSGEGVPLFDTAHPWVCSYAMAWSADRFAKGSGRHKLGACCERRGIRIVGAHRAEADAIAAGMLFFSIMGGDSKTTAQQLLAMVDRRESEREQDWAEYQKRKNAEDRLIWREYAKAALSGACARETSYHDAHRAEIAAGVANLMVARERELFG